MRAVGVGKGHGHGQRVRTECLGLETLMNQD